MTSYFLHDDALGSPELRHEIAEPLSDPVGFIEHAGKRIVIVNLWDEPIMAVREDIIDEVWTFQDLGYDELSADESFDGHLIGPEIMLRGLARAGASSVVVPPTLPVQTADYLRERGVEITIDDAAWSERRRVKTPWELEGFERAQRAADTAMLTAARMLRDAEPARDGSLRFEGEPLTAELIRWAMSTELLTQGTESEEIIVACGDVALSGHELGTGPITPDTSVVIDCFPRDLRTGVWSDMTRTFVAGEPSEELRRLHKLVREALEIALDAVRPGRDDAFSKVAEYFESNDMPTLRTHTGPDPLRSGFMHSLGHGVGLQLHERPWIGRRSEAFMPGDVVAIEPGLYFEGVGGVRLEDTVLVTDDGAQHITDPYPYDLAP